MLTKLLRYEFKSTGRVVLPIAAGVLVLNIFTNILSHFVQNTSDRLPLAGVAMALLALASAVSLLVVLAICAFIEIQQFYRLLGERGYLMLALHGMDAVRHGIFYTLRHADYRHGQWRQLCI